MIKESEIMGVFKTPPRAPRSNVVAIREVIDPYEISMMRREELPVFKDMVVRSMAQKLADYIIENCGVLVLPENLTAMKRLREIQMEFSINDRSAYEGWIPRAEAEGRKRGEAEATKRERDRIPYGMEPGQFYE